MDSPHLLARDLALLASTNPEAFCGMLHELAGALAAAPAAPPPALYQILVYTIALCRRGSNCNHT